MRRGGRQLAGAATLVLVLAAAGASGHAALLSRAPIVSGNHRYVPATGDWEGTADGFGASFELLYEPGYAVYGSRVVQYGFEDLTVVQPAACPISPGQSGQEIIANHHISPVFAGGYLHAGKAGVYGGLTGARTAKLWVNFRRAQVPGSPGCRRTLIWHLHPAHRRPVQDGLWKLRFSDGETGSFTVAGGGRVASGLAFPQNFTCGLGGINLFIGPDGHSFYGDASVNVALRFAQRSASGTMSGGAGTTSPCRLGMSASLHKPAP